MDISSLREIYAGVTDQSHDLRADMYIHLPGRRENPDASAGPACSIGEFVSYPLTLSLGVGFAPKNGCGSQMSVKKKTSKAFRPINSRIYSRNRCFYCGNLLRNKNSKEHVFPKWLQEKFNLWDQTIHLLNGTTPNSRFHAARPVIQFTSQNLRTALSGTYLVNLSVSRGSTPLTSSSG